jgi:hypothetical protein
MSIFAGGFDLGAALAVCDDMALTVSDAVDIVDALVDRSLVLAVHDTAGTRYRLLEPVRQWAADRPGEIESVRRRHAQHYADLIATLSPRLREHGQQEAFRRIEADLPNLRIAFDTLADRCDVDCYLDMAFGLYTYWAHKGPYLEGFEVCSRGLELASRVGADLERQVKVAYVATMCAGWMRRRVAFDLADRCQALANQLASPRAAGWAALVRAIVMVNNQGGLGSFDGATEHVLEARELFDAHPGPSWWDPRWERGFQQMLFASFLTPSVDRVAEFDEAERILTAHGDDALVVTLYSQCVPLVDFMGRDRVMELLARGAESPASPQWANTCRSSLAYQHQVAGEHAQAAHHLRIAFEQSVNWGDSNGAIRGRGLAVSLCAVGEIDEAKHVMMTVLEAAGPQLGERELCRSFGVVASVLAADGQHELAALALGAARGEDEDRHDAVSATRARLIELLGTDEVARLESDGEALDAAAVTARVRSALAT